jgi:hypothetical protein
MSVDIERNHILQPHLIGVKTVRLAERVYRRFGRGPRNPTVFARSLRHSLKGRVTIDQRHPGFDSVTLVSDAAFNESDPAFRSIEHGSNPSFEWFGVLS